MRVLLVEDDPAISQPLMRALAREGIEATLVATGADAMGAAADHEVVLLDLGLPDVDGLIVCREIRRLHPHVAVIVVTARAGEMDRVTLLELGADDYVIKPFGQRELIARIRAVHRRTGRTADDVVEDEPVTVGRVSVDHRMRKVTVDEEEIRLTPKEFDLLSFLLEDAGAVRTRDEILRSVWDEHWFGSSKTLDVHMASLRRKLGVPDLIETVRGVGFRINSPQSG